MLLTKASLGYERQTVSGPPFLISMFSNVSLIFPCLVSFYKTVFKDAGAAFSGAGFLLFATLSAPAAHKSIYIAGGLFNEQVANLRSSGFDTAILWSVHVNGSAALNLNNDTLIDASGQYVYGQWARVNCAKLKEAPTSISRIEFSVGSAGATDFENIENWINTDHSEGGTGPGSRLRRNFQALRDAFPQVDAINFDDESNYDLSSTTAFAIMLVDLGYQITFAPYTRESFWDGLYDAIEAQRPGAVDHIYLQRYAGGGGNNPSAWNELFGSLKVEPGLWAGDASTFGRRDPSEVEEAMDGWRESADIPGGFIWRLTYTWEGGHSVQDYAAAIEGTYTSEFDDAASYQLVNRFSGKSLAVVGENIAGVPAPATANGAEVAQYQFRKGDERFSWQINDLGNGQRSLVNRHSGKSLAVFGTRLDGVTPVARSEDFADIAQWDFLGNNWYQWRLTDVGDGYRIINKHSAKAMTVFGSDTSGAPFDRVQSGADVAQYTYTGQEWYHWDIVEISEMEITGVTLENGLIRLSIEGARPSTSLTIESSPTMAEDSWTVEGTVAVGADGRSLFQGPRPGEGTYFYRAKN